jgi:hypothetical protein
VQAWGAGLVASSLSPSHVRDTVDVLAGVLGLAVRDRRQRRARTSLRTICGLARPLSIRWLGKKPLQLSEYGRSSGGRYWDRTSDRSGVSRVLSR